MNLLQYFTNLQKKIYLYLLLLNLSLTRASLEHDMEILDSEQKRSCHRQNQPSFEVRAILIPCSMDYCPCSNTPGTTTLKTSDFTPEDDDQKITNTKKLIITVKMTNMGITNCKNQYVVVDHVYDLTTEHKQRLLYPYVLKIKQKPIVQTYHLHKECLVNEKSTELVKNKNDKNYKGCTTTGDQPTCDRVIYKDEPIPFSTGFCCSCEDKKDEKNEKEGIKICVDTSSERSKREALDKDEEGRKTRKDVLVEYDSRDDFNTDFKKCEPKVEIIKDEEESFFETTTETSKNVKKQNENDKDKKLNLKSIFDDDDGYIPPNYDDDYDIEIQSKRKPKPYDDFDDNNIIKNTEEQEESDLNSDYCCSTTQNSSQIENVTQFYSSFFDSTESETVKCDNDNNIEMNLTEILENEIQKKEKEYEEQHKLDLFESILQLADTTTEVSNFSEKNESLNKKIHKNVKLYRPPIYIPIIRTYYIHPRGGQNCSDKTCPKGVDPKKYHQSTHCLTFSKLWYTVYGLQKPVIYHELSLEIFEKHEDVEGHVRWNDLTNGKALILGTFNPQDTDKNNTVWAGYVGNEPPPNAYGIDTEIHKLLVPEPLEPCEMRHIAKYPELKGGAYEWLVVPNYMITYDGTRCDKVGVGYEAFVKQPNRCAKPRGTCLRNQPKDLWYHDHRLEQRGQTGCYFLKYYGFLPRHPIENTTHGGKNLTLYFRGAYFNTLNIELKTEYNLVLRPSTSAVITEVYVDSTNYIKSIITVKVTNAGLVYGVFFVAITDCPLDMPASFNNIQTKPATIAPQHQHIFVIEVMCPLPEKKFFCSVEAKNVKSDLLAFRRIRFQKNDRCICIWHCCCACLDADGGLKCNPLPFDLYNAAGFHGGLPVVADYVEFTLVEELMALLYHLFLTMTVVLILMGILKGIIGFFYKPIGEWGLCTMLGLPKPMKSYHEKSLKGRPVIYDSCGWPLHPDTRKRVRNASMVVEFCINAIFFLIYPLVIINVIVRRMCFIEAWDESDRPPCCLCGQKHEAGECPSFGILSGLGFYKRCKKHKYKHVCVQCSAYEDFTID